MGGSEIPGLYNHFLQLINGLSLDAFQILPLSCLRSFDHLHKLCMETLVPIGILLLVLTVRIAPLLAHGQHRQALSRTATLLAGVFEILVFFLPNMYDHFRAPSLPVLASDFFPVSPVF